MNPSTTGGVSSLRPMTQSFDVFVELCLNKWLSKQSTHRWLETQSRSSWRHCNATAEIWRCRKTFRRWCAGPRVYWWPGSLMSECCDLFLFDIVLCISSLEINNITSCVINKWYNNLCYYRWWIMRWLWNYFCNWWYILLSQSTRKYEPIPLTWSSWRKSTRACFTPYLFTPSPLTYM